MIDLTTSERNWILLILALVLLGAVVKVMRERARQAGPPAAVERVIEQ